jgi:enoyl-CoA hydratase/carnithine racemase
MNISDHVSWSIAGPIFHIRLERPEKRNALTLEMMDAIAAAAVESDRHPEARAILVSAEGPIFSAGIDLMALMTAKSASGNTNPARFSRRLAERLQNSLNVLESTELPVIGALHGQVLGMGLETALAFDLRVAADDCVFRFPEVALGLVADVGGTTRLSRTVGPSRAKDMLMTGRALEAQEALEWGLVNRVAPEAKVLATAEALCFQIAENAPLAVGLSKRIIDQGDGLDKASQMAIERWAQSQLLSSEDVGEAVSAFFEKRKPEFKGR